MAACGTCGAENPEGFLFCGACGSRLPGAVPSRELRKTVTIVFSDVSGSTAMGEQLDPEALRGVMSEYFDRMKADVERHGGTVEKFIGDAVMAVFGVPATHEDDALRAVRAAVAMRQSLEGINEDLQRAHGLTLSVRTGVNTGEVIAGEGIDRQRLVTGDAVNVAARLEQAAPTDEILLGRDTFRLVRDAVDVEELAPLDLKGKAEPVPAYRLVELRDVPAEIARRSDTVFVGRRRELGLLVDAFSRTTEDWTCHLFTVLGSAGVGKSRLVAGALESINPRPRVISGRCLPYGEGITFWPVLEMIRTACGIDEATPSSTVEERIGSVLTDVADRDVVRQRLTDLFGLSASSAGSLEETFWAVRRFMESLATDASIVVVFDDLHWAEPALLELIEHLSDWSRDAPMLVVCLARPEFLDARPAWSGGKMNATTILLEPLDGSDSEMLVRDLMTGGSLPPPFVARVAQIAEGNPLFVEELLAMLIDEGALARDGDQ